MNSNFSKFRSSLLNEHNRLRADPLEYIEIIKKYLDSIDQDDCLTFSNGQKYPLREGKKSFQEAISFLERQPPIKILAYDEVLSQAAQDWADFLSDGSAQYNISTSSLAQRLDKYLEWDFACAESIDLGSSSPRDVIVTLLADDGVVSRCHRENLFREDVNYIGIGISIHKDYGTCVVMNYVGWIRGNLQEIYENYFLCNPFYQNMDSLSVDIHKIKNKHKKNSNDNQVKYSSQSFIYDIERDCKYSNNLIIFKNE